MADLPADAIEVTIWLRSGYHRTCSLLPTVRDQLVSDWEAASTGPINGSPIRIYELATMQETPMHWMIDVSAIEAVQI